MNKEEIKQDNYFIEEDFESPYCETCGTCGCVDCCGIRNFIEHHIEGKTNCKNEGWIISDLIDLCEYKDKVFEENKKLKEQLEYLRSGEYYNQLRFERDMLQDLVNKGEVSKEDKEFIDCTHRNTELLEINEEHRKLNGKLREELSLLNDMNTNNYNKYTDVLKKLTYLKDEIIKDRMEQFDDYVIYLLNKYINILDEE